MNFLRLKTSAFVLLLALSVNNLHEWLPHAEESACEICLYQSIDGLADFNNEPDQQWVDFSHFAVPVSLSTFSTQNALIEPIRGSPSLQS